MYSQRSIAPTGASLVPAVSSPRSRPVVSAASATTPMPIWPPVIVFVSVRFGAVLDDDAEEPGAMQRVVRDPATVRAA